MKGLLFLLLLISEAFPAPSQTQGLQHLLHFDRINTENGLSYSNVNCVLQDSRGFVWVGTANGLNRYDGNSFVIYRRDRNNKNSIASNDIRSLAEDARGNIWIGTTNGVSRLNPYGDQFVSFYHSDTDSTSLSADYINHVFVDREKNIWMGNPGGLNKFDPSTNSFRAYKLKSPDGKIQSVTSFCEQDADHLWIGTMNGLFLFNKQTARSDYYNPLKNQGFLVTSLCRDVLGNIWIGTWAFGAFRFDIATQKFSQYLFNFSTQYVSATNIVLSIAQTVKSENDFSVWLGTTEGLLRIDVRNKIYPMSLENLPCYKNDPANLSSLSSNDIHHLTTDRNGTLWIATGNGLNKLIPSLQAFDVVQSSGSVYKVLAERNDKWVVSWYGIGASHYDSSWKEIEHFARIPPYSATIDNGQVSSVIREGNSNKDNVSGDLWFATFNGLVRYDEYTKKFSLFVHDEKDSSSISENRITCLFNDSRNRLWVGTYSKGLNVKLPGGGSFTHYTHNSVNPSSLCDNKIWMITEDLQRNVWVATNYGLARYNDSTNTFTNFYFSEKNESVPSDNTLTSVYVDRIGRIWASTHDGFYRWNTHRKDFDAVDQPKELTNTSIYGILDDQAGNLWLATQNGLIRYDPERENISVFDRRDGLPYNDLSGSFDKDEFNHFYLGTGDGRVIIFKPGDLNFKVPAPQAYITSLKVFDKSFPLDSISKNNNSICLPYNQNMLSFQFTAPNYIHADRMQFAYQMKGLDKEWNIAGSNRSATYSSLPPGNYSFYVKTTSANGEWSEKEAMISITITPPFWKTYWFMVISALAIVALIFFIVRFRILRIKKREEEKTIFNKQLAEVEMKALRAQMNPHFIFNALNSIQECVVTHQNDAAYHYLSKFSKLVRLILENSEQSLVSVKKELEALRLYLDLESLRFQNFSYSISVDNSIDQEAEKIPAMLIQPFAENSIKHGLATKEGLRFLKIELQKKQNNLQLIVEDNGVGRERSAELKTTLRKDHESRGMKITEDRIKLIGAKNKMEVHLNVIDLYDDAKNAAGTRVEIEIPNENEIAA